MLIGEFVGLSFALTVVKAVMMSRLHFQKKNTRSDQLPGLKDQLDNQIA
jgi:hypothetical protein